MKFSVKVSFPSDTPKEDTCVDAGGESTAAIQIRDQDTSGLIAYVGFVRYTCPSSSGTTLIYEINPIGVPGGGRNTNSVNFAWETFDDRFHEFTFIIEPDGTSRWERNGITKLSNSRSMPPKNLVMALKGVPYTVLDLFFDDVRVEK